MEFSRWKVLAGRGSRPTSVPSKMKFLLAIILIAAPSLAATQSDEEDDAPRRFTNGHAGFQFRYASVEQNHRNRIKFTKKEQDNDILPAATSYRRNSYVETNRRSENDIASTISALRVKRIRPTTTTTTTTPSTPTTTTTRTTTTTTQQPAMEENEIITNKTIIEQTTTRRPFKKLLINKRVYHSNQTNKKVRNTHRNSTAPYRFNRRKYVTTPPQTVVKTTQKNMDYLKEYLKKRQVNSTRTNGIVLNANRRYTSNQAANKTRNNPIKRSAQHQNINKRLYQRLPGKTFESLHKSNNN